MKLILSSFLTLMLLTAAVSAQSQTILNPKEDSLFNARGEIYFKFQMYDKNRVDSISAIISIDNYLKGEVFAFANRDEFMRFLNLKIAYVVLPPPISLMTPEQLNMGNLEKNDQNMTIWNSYPNYSQYLASMYAWASSYPSICHLDTIGVTKLGHLLLALKISDSVNFDRGVPRVLFTSSIHGDELTGYVCMMHLIDTLLNSYGTSTRITNILHKTKLYINPLANPDGTYHTGDNITGATRANANGIDMNRNYPDPSTNQHPDGNMWQPETMAFMDYADRQHFSLSINFHGGAEVINYPWDDWTTAQKVTADNSWWAYVSKEYADTVHRYGTSGYFTSPYTSGYTDGGDWYVVTGGRQDCHNYFKHDKEVTAEISTTKTPAASTLPRFFTSNIHSFLNYIEQATYGINGKVYDSVTFAPIAAKVLISTHDVDSSWVYSSLPTGWYFRLIDTGPWNLTFSAPGYYSRTINGVSSTRHVTNNLNVKLRPLDQYWPSGFMATAIGGNEIDLSWKKNTSGDPVIIAYNTTNTFGTPTNGSVYTPGMSITGGGSVLYNGTNTTYQNLYLNPGTTYYYRAWSVRSGTTYSASAPAYATTYCGVYNTFPLTENFATASVQLPNCWSQEISSATAVYKWSRVSSANAGGTAWEMKLATQSVTGTTTRLKTYFFNTLGVSVLTLSFKHYAVGTNTGETLKIQSSTDGVTWVDESWSVASSNSMGAATTINLNITHNLNSPTTMIAFVATGDLSRVTWYIDDVNLKAPGYWVGGTPAALTDWNTATNWGDGLVPVSATNVYIPGRMFLPLVSTLPASPATCNNLVLSPKATLSVGSGKQITVSGKFTLQAP